jgi:hypothetical protein
VLALTIALALLAACARENPAPAATGEPTQTAAPVATATATPQPTATPTATPTQLPLASIAGRALDEATGQPVAGASVSACEVRATTDEDGQFLIEGLAPGQYVVVVEHPDYDPFVSGILGLRTGEARHVDALLSAGGAAAVPRDPMASNQVDPAGAPTAADAERLARLQGFEGEVASIQQTVLDGEYLVNYKVGESLRAAQAALQHPAWELIDQDGASWYIVQVCGNLAVARPAQVQVPESHVTQPHPVVTVGEADVPGYACPDEACEVVTTLPAGWYGTVLGCAQQCQWLWVQVPGSADGCWIQSDGSALYGDPGAALAIPGEMQWTTAEWLGPGGGPTQVLLTDHDQTVWAIWEEHAHPKPGEPLKVYEPIHYSVWTGEAWSGPATIPGSDNTGEATATVLRDSSILVYAGADADPQRSSWQTVWYRWDGGQWATVQDIPQPPSTPYSAMAVAADGFGNVHVIPSSHYWDGSSWNEYGNGGVGANQPDAVAKDQAGSLHTIAATQASVEHWTWDGSAWSAEPVYTLVDSALEKVSDAAIAVGPDGSLHAVWVGTTPREYKIGSNPPMPRPHWFNYSKRTASGWTPPVRIFEAITDDNPFSPSIVVLPDGLVVAAIGDVSLGVEGLWNGAFVTWGMGQTWAEPVRVSPDIKTDPSGVSLAVDAQGRVHLLYYDRASQGVFTALGTRP